MDDHDDVLAIKVEDIPVLSSAVIDAFMRVLMPANRCKSTVPDEENARGWFELVTVGDVFF